LAHTLKKGGHSACTSIKRSHIAAARGKMAATPAQARSFLDTMRGLFRWAVEAQHVKEDPTIGVKNSKEATGEGFPIWTEADIDAYQKKWPLGAKERVWLDVLLYTGLRRGDAVTLGRQHARDGVATLRTEKSQRTITVSLPILPVLAKTLARRPDCRVGVHLRRQRKAPDQRELRQRFPRGLQQGRGGREVGPWCAQGGCDQGGRQRRDGT
jgi:site-specific recombinase XerD